jgi:dTMP kinase
MHLDFCCRGPLVSVEGISGVGKTYLTQMLAASLAKQEAAPVVTEDFTARQQPGRRDLGRDLLKVLTSASSGDRFLRGGYPAAETLLLLAIKMYDYETSLPQLASGHVVIEGRSLHTTAIYQSVILYSGDTEALTQAREILQLAGQWRPLPDLTILLTDDPATAISRAELRDNRTIAPEERRIHFRAAALYDQLAADDTTRIRVLDRRLDDAATALNSMQEWISQARHQISCLPESWAIPKECTGSCRLRGMPAPAGTTRTPPGG